MVEAARWQNGWSDALLSEVWAYLWGGEDDPEQPSLLSFYPRVQAHDNNHFQQSRSAEAMQLWAKHVHIHIFPHVSGSAASPPPTSPSSTPATHPFVRSLTAVGCRASKGEQSQALKGSDPLLLAYSVQLRGCYFSGTLKCPNSSWDVVFRAKAKSQMCHIESPGVSLSGLWFTCIP